MGCSDVLMNQNIQATELNLWPNKGLSSAFLAQFINRIINCHNLKNKSLHFKGFIFFLHIWHSAKLGLLSSRTPCQLFTRAMLAVASHALRRASLLWPWEEGAALNLQPAMVRGRKRGRQWGTAAWTAGSHTLCGPKNMMGMMGTVF